MVPIYLVDDDIAFADSLLFVLDSYGLKATHFDNAPSFIENCDLTQAGVAILDSRMPKMTGEQLHQHLVDAHSPLGTIFLTGHGDLPMAVQAFRAGASDFFQKPVDAEALVAAIEKASELSLKRHQTSERLGLLSALSERELQILQLIGQGLKNKQISDALFLSTRTVEVHRAKLMKKLGAENMAELVEFALIHQSTK
ncbi:response regulator transcription factor [Paraferrimonas sedimenticola]|uniref:DNA-binding response regulator n=1 Tax=Paraferrimonas sedimenticola TaxID=375674 RepID=A0AA37VYH6_9GAMM|nr:response regulator [Paraferrimonas sedimenticola]GLP97061.1 DNA-binding response regulator [Paraferrimonas sedimenticola]